MRRFAVAVLLLMVSVTTTYTQDALTRDQRIDDLTQLASFYAKNYAPYEWKRRRRTSICCGSRRGSSGSATRTTWSSMSGSSSTSLR